MSLWQSVVWSHSSHLGTVTNVVDVVVAAVVVVIIVVAAVFFAPKKGVLKMF